MTVVRTALTASFFARSIPVFMRVAKSTAIGVAPAEIQPPCKSTCFRCRGKHCVARIARFARLRVGEERIVGASEPQHHAQVRLSPRRAIRSSRTSRRARSWPNILGLWLMSSGEAAARDNTRPSGHGVVGREAELAALHAFLEVDESARALVVTGAAGIGKTTLWEAGLGAARERGFRVLSSRASSAEAQLSYAALIDLLEGVEREELADIPTPQLQALEVALLRAEPSGAPPEARAIQLGFLNALRVLAADRPLLVAIDDVPWLDGPSGEALTFAARRLDVATVTFLLARRPARAPALEQALGERKVRDLEVGPLSLGATRRLLSERLGLSLPRHFLRQLVAATLGNPLFSLEVGRMVATYGLPALGEELPVPDTVDDLLGARMARLSPPARRLVLALALGRELDIEHVPAIADEAVLDAAVADGIVSVEDGRVRVSHPLLAAAVKRRAPARARRELHLQLAGVMGDEELRARHLALGTQHPDTELARAVADAATSASARGARQDAAELSTHAWRLTPPADGERAERLLELAGHLELAGATQQIVDLLEPELDALPPGEPRVRALLLLVECGRRTGRNVHKYHELALAESGDDARLRAYVLPSMAVLLGTASVERLRDAEALAAEALAGAGEAGPDVERLALDALAWLRGLRGAPPADANGRHRAATGYIAASAERIAALRLTWRGEVDRARELHRQLLALADKRGETISYALEHLHLCELELRAGDCDAASRLLEEWMESLDQDYLAAPSPTYERCRALLAAVRGPAGEAEDWASNILGADKAAIRASRWNWLEALRACGISALLAREPGRAAESLGEVWEHTRREGVDEPGVFPVAPDLVEALVELGELDEARTVTDRLRRLSEAQGHPWGLASAARCAGLIALAAGSYDDEAAAALSQAAAAYATLGLRFDAARSMLAQGRAQRRSRKWAAARKALEQAVAAFDAIGSTGWAEEARSELTRVGARRPQPAGELTPTERRVAALAAEGLSNKEIAQTLFVTVKTVEAHLSHAYAKLRVRSRSQLPRHASGDQ